MDEIVNKIYLQAQKYFSDAPVIVLGSGASAAHGLPGMWHLSEHLKSNIHVNKTYKTQWNDFVNMLDKGTDLETALQNARLDPTITKEIIYKTWELINPKDLEVFFQSLTSPLPLASLIEKYFNSALHELNIITTNYDRLAEYACDQNGLYHYTGFSSGFLRKPEKNKLFLRPNRRVNIWKVHGSLDWFKDQNQMLIGLSNLENIPQLLTPEIVTPGIEKYSKTHSEPYRTIIQEADSVLEAKNSYLCIGYGFNDSHIQEKLVNKCIHENAKLIIITHTLSDATHQYIINNGCKNYLAFEINDTKNTKVYSSELTDPIIIENSDFWSLSGFLKLI